MSITGLSAMPEWQYKRPGKGLYGFGFQNVAAGRINGLAAVNKAFLII